MSRRRAIVAAATLVVLTTATSASSRPAAGITITAQEPITAIIGSGVGGVYQLGIVVSARFNPDALHDDARVTITSTKPGGVGSSPFTGRDTGNVLHSTAVYQNVVAAFEGDRLLITTKWHAWTPLVSGNVEGTKTSPIAIVQVPKREPAPRLDSVKKDRLASLATKWYAICAAHGTAGLAAPGAAPAAFLVAAEYCAGAAYAHDQALDPVDLNFKVVAKPKTPPALKVSAGQGLSAVAAAALNKLLTLKAKEIGLGRTIVTAFNRSQGAHVKKQVVWEKRQVLAAGKYATRLSALLLAEAKLGPSVRRTLPPLTVSEEQAFAFQDSLVARPLPARLAASLAKLGQTKSDLEDVRAQLTVRNHPTLYDGDAFATIADPLYLLLLRQVAADLRNFAKQVARDPLRIP